MKRSFVAVLMVIILCATCMCCFGEEETKSTFSFRNGVMFGDTPEEIKAKESTEAGEQQNSLIYPRITLSGIENSNIYYCFDNNKLNMIGISYNCNPKIRLSLCFNRGWEKGLKQAGEDYEKIEAGLQRKYGDPLKNQEDMVYYPGGAFSIVYELNEDDKNIRATSQRIIELETGENIIIEHVFCSYDKDDETYHLLTYQIVNANGSPEDIIDKDL